MLMSSYGLSSEGACMRMRRSVASVKFRQAGDELVDEDLHVARGRLYAGQEVIVAEERGNRDSQTRDRGRERRGDSGSDRVHVDVARLGDCGERDHDADHGAQQAEEWPP